jgi:hypothetical protein
MRPTRCLACALALAALVLALGACGPETIDPLAQPTTFSFEVANPDEIAGPVFGAMVVPFEPSPMFGMRKLAPASINLDAFVDVMTDTDLATSGQVSGSLITVYDVPRVNEALGLEFGWLTFFPPEGCPMTTTNPTEAAIAPIIGLAVWDGESFVDDEPDFDGLILLETVERVDGGGGAYTDTLVSYVPVASRTAWSATTDGPCVPVGPDITLDVDLQIAAGWQFLRRTSVETFDGLTWTYQEEIVSLTLEQVAEAGVIGEVIVPVIASLGPLEAAPARSGLGTLFR